MAHPFSPPPFLVARPLRKELFFFLRLPILNYSDPLNKLCFQFNYHDMTSTGYPIEKYVGWAVTSSKFIFILVVWYLFWKTIFCIWKFCREIFGLIYVFLYSEYFKHQTSHYNNIIKKGALNGIKKKRPSDLLYRLLWGPKILGEKKGHKPKSSFGNPCSAVYNNIQILNRRDIYIWI